MIVNLDQEEVGKEMLDALITALNQGEDHIDIYLNSCGGTYQYGLAIIDIINKHKDRVSLIGYKELSSAGFEIFFFSECEKSLLANTLGMFHQSYGKFTTNSDGRLAHPGDKSVMEMMHKAHYPALVNLVTSLGATPPELKKLKKGDDVWLSNGRMMEMLDFQNKNKK